MVCEHINSEVLDSRTTKRNPLPKRRRRCLDCGLRFTTIETIANKTQADEIARLKAKLRAAKRVLEDIE